MRKKRLRLSAEEIKLLGLKQKRDNRYFLDVEQLHRLQDFREKSDNTVTNQYERKEVATFANCSAVDSDGSIMSIDRYCEVYGLDRSQIRSYKLVTHTGTPFYNIASGNVEEEECELTLEEIKAYIADDLANITYRPLVAKKDKRPIVVHLADLHFGAYIDGLKRTKPFSINILANLLQEVADLTNAEESNEVHVHILGDLIESFTGLNHKNSWKGLQKGMIGAEAVKLCARVLHDNLLSRITNLATVKIIAGNHDRVTSDKEEDTDGGAADLIAWGLQLMGYDVEFDPFVLTHQVDGINYIMLHGHEGISKKSTKEICWDYGVQGMFNFITEGHLHSIIEKLSVSQRKNFNVIKDDAVDHRRMHVASLFTGNSYSERLGYTSNSGFMITRNNGKGVPHANLLAL